MTHNGYPNQLPETGAVLPDMVAQQAAAFEANFWRGSAPDTFRGLSDYNELLKPFGVDIRDEIAGKVVGDVGSGIGGLAKTAYVEGIDATVRSINPHFTEPEFKRFEEENTADSLRRDYPGLSDEAIEGAQAYHDTHLATDFAHDLSFDDETFDLLTDVVAVNAYALEDKEALYARTMSEMLRVLKPGGKILIVDGYRTAIGVRDEVTGEPMFKEKVLQEMGVRYTSVYDPKRPDVVVGAIVFKDGEAERRNV